MMRAASRNWWACFGRDRRANTAVIVAMGVPVLFGSAVLAIDLGNLHSQRNLLQIAADSAALAGAYAINEGTSPVTAALAYADKNKTKLNGTILTGGDVVTGNWSTSTDPVTGTVTRTFQPGASPVNAVQVTTRRSQGNGNPVQMYFAVLLGVTTMDVNARAVAIAGGDNDTGIGDCWESGARAGGTLTMGQDVSLQSTCVYGQNGVDFGQNPFLGPEAAVGTPDCVTWPTDCPGFTTGQNPDIQGNVTGMDLSTGSIADDPTQTRNCILNFIAMLKAGVVDPTVPCGDVWPSYIMDVVYDTTGTTLPPSPAPGTAYIFRRNVSIGQNYTLTDSFVISEGSISWTQAGEIRNSVNSCVDSTQTTIGVFAVNDITLGQDAYIRGAALWAGRTMTIGQNVANLGASLRSGGNMNISQDPNFEGCELNFDGALGTGSSGGGGSEEQVVRLVK